MGTSSEEIVAKEFDRVRKGGYDPDQVTSYLRSVADGVTRLQADLEKARADVRAAQTRADQAEEKAASNDAEDDFAKLGSRVAAVLQSAETHAAEITDEARADAERFRREADEYDRRVRGEADDYSRRTRADADAYAELVGAEAESRARGRVETILSEASESRRRTTETEQHLLERLRATAEDVRLTLASFEGAVAGTDRGDDPGDVDTVFDEVREAASVFATASGLPTGDGDSDDTQRDDGDSDDGASHRETGDHDDGASHRETGDHDDGASHREAGDLAGGGATDQETRGRTDGRELNSLWSR